MDFSSVELIVFDLDYTLIDSSDGIVFCFNEARRRAGEEEVSADKIKPWIGQPIEETFRRHGSKNPPAMRDLFRRIAAAGPMAERTRLLPAVAETLAELHARGYQLAVASTKSRAEIQAILERLYLRSYFAELCGSDEVEKPKPAPDPLLKVMARVGRPPEKTVYVGDHLVDIRAARAAGTAVIAITGTGGPCPLEEVKAAAPDAVITCFSELTEIFASPPETGRRNFFRGH